MFIDDFLKFDFEQIKIMKYLIVALCNSIHKLQKSNNYTCVKSLRRYI